MEKNAKLIVGLEIHVELKTKSKMFCQCSADWFGKEPNTNTCPVCLGMPGALPVPNEQAIEDVVKIGHALNCKVNTISKFDRKHYLYPDLPKGYQISQYDVPFNYDGYYLLGGKKIGIIRVHMEEDTGKLSHLHNKTLVDFNRSGVPLVEIVTAPDFDNAEDIKKFLEELQVLIRYLGVSDADMEKGSMRLEPNISVKLTSKTNTGWEQPLTKNGLPTYKVEVKNINSFNFVKKAVEIEFKRQHTMLQRGEVPAQETRGYDDIRGVTYSQRSKENAEDYRYFPEPDIPPIELDEAALHKIFSTIPELPHEKVARLVKEYKVKEQDAYTLTRDIAAAAYFENVLKEIKEPTEPQKILNLIVNKKLTTDLSPKEFAVKALELLAPKQFDEALLKQIIQDVLKSHGRVVEEYKKGKTGVLMFLVGQVMRQTKGQADAQVVRSELEKVLA